MRLKCKLSLCPHKPVHAGTHIRTWSALWGHQYLVPFHCRTFHFLFSISLSSRAQKKHKNSNKRISYFFSLRCFLSAFLIFVRLFAFCAFARLRFCAFWCFLDIFGAFWGFMVGTKSFLKKNKINKIKSLKLF